ncbi:MAG: glycoside hydrolase family 15 protein [Phycisphaerales bacterium]
MAGTHRYERDYYHQVEGRRTSRKVPGSPWIICTLWQAQHEIALAASVDELKGALGYLGWCVQRAHESGVLAEQYHPYTGEPISVSPLTWSHATFVVVCVEYLERLAALTTAASASLRPARSDKA